MYSWNPRDQMTKAEKFTGTGDAYAGKVEYFYCLSCDGALSVRKEFDSGSTTVPISWKRFEYDGLNLLRVDERYDDETSPPDGIDSGDPWRTLEVATHKPGALGALLGKRVYSHTNNDANPDSTTDYGYVYDAVGNVMSVYLDDDDEGAEAFYFVQDAFGNEVDVAPFSGDDWGTAADVGVTEHQTGKWIDPFTGLYFFHARWYQGEVGRFVSRSKLPVFFEPAYEFVANAPTVWYDSNGENPLGKVIEWLAKKGIKGLDDLAKAICKCKKFPKPGKHKGFIEQLCKKTEKELQKDVNSRLRLIEEHLKKINDNPGSIHENHWKKEIENWMSELACIEAEMAKRGMAGAAVLGTCCAGDCCSDEGGSSGGGCNSGVCLPQIPEPTPDQNSDPLGWLVDFIFGCEAANAPGD